MVFSIRSAFLSARAMEDSATYALSVADACWALASRAKTDCS